MVALTIFVSVHLSVVYTTEIAGVAKKKITGKIARKFTGIRFDSGKLLN